MSAQRGTSGSDDERARCQHCENLADERSYMCEDCAFAADKEVDDLRRALADVLFQQVLRHPLPWRVQSDWTEEVIAADGHCIAKCQTTEDAEAIIAAAGVRAE